MSTWILVANASRARVFAAENSNDKWAEVGDFVHSASRMHGRELETDTHGTMVAHTEVKEHEKETFSKELSQSLRKAYHEGRYNKLYIVAGPKFLGLLRSDMDSETKKHVHGEIDKDMVMRPIAEIRDHLPEYL